MKESAKGERRLTLRIRGRVQGVFFRETARQQAERLGVRGWIRNLPDGDVEAVVEGPEDRLEAFARWAHEGPPAAQVEEVRWADGEATGEFDRFEVRR
jgi:acylphosphatase